VITAIRFSITAAENGARVVGLCCSTTRQISELSRLTGTPESVLQ